MDSHSAFPYFGLPLRAASTRIPGGCVSLEQPRARHAAGPDKVPSLALTGGKSPRGGQPGKVSPPYLSADRGDRRGWAPLPKSHSEWARPQP